ncbi:MAG TPA: GTP cyclohydrolase I, partial [Anaeromyxobacter sp.]|nr:GTP cyclohydrolase I [Anaeromyxobacter sp.]
MAVRPLRAARRSVRADAAAAAEAVSRFLDALGLPPDVRGAPDVAGTPARVAEAWLQDLVDGYSQDPAEILAESIPSRSRDLVAVTGIDYHSVCPHHLLPSRGLAHVAYVPGGKVVGFGQIVRLVDALAHRLVLQEDLAGEIADALVEHLGAKGAACLLDAEQLCMTVRGERRSRSRAHAESFAGSLAKDGAARRRLLALAAGSGSGSGSDSRSRSRSGARSRSGSRSGAGSRS